MSKLVRALAFCFVASPALAQEPPESVYAKLHRAAIAGNLPEMLKYATEARRVEIAAMPGGPETARLIGAMMPRTYTVTSTARSNGENSALMRATGQGNFLGGTQTLHGTVQFLKEKGEWKVDRWEWGDKPGDVVTRVQQKPPAALAAPVAPSAPSAPKAPARPTAPPAISVERTSNVPMGGGPAQLPQGVTTRPPADCQIKPVMTDDDLKACGSRP